MAKQARKSEDKGVPVGLIIFIIIVIIAVISRGDRAVQTIKISVQRRIAFMATA